MEISKLRYRCLGVERKYPNYTDISSALKEEFDLKTLENIITLLTNPNLLVIDQIWQAVHKRIQ